MAGRIAGITIEIGGDTTNLQKSLKGVDSQLRKTQSNLKDVNKLLKLDPGNTELLVQKQKNLETAISTTKTRLEELKNAQNGVSQGSEEWDALQREIIATEQSLQGLENEYVNFGSVAAQQVAAAGQKISEAGDKISAVGDKLKPLSAAAAGIVTSLAGLGYSAITASDDLNTLANQTGLTTAEIQKMQYASDMIDVSFSDIEGALKKMKSKMDPANATFQQLGVSVTNADGSMRGASEVFYEAIEALSQVENETERDQVAMDLFGKSADSLAGIIDDGGAALKEYGKQAEDLGLILSQDTLDSLNELNDTIDVLKANFTGAFARLGSTIALQFGPSLQKAAEYAQQLADRIANLSPETVSLIAKIAGVVAVIAPLTIGLGKVTKGVGTMLKTVPKVVGTVKKAGTAIKAVSALLSPQVLIIGAVVAAVVAAGVLIYKNWDKIKAATQKMADAVKKAWNDLQTSVTNAANAVKTSVTTAWTNLKTTVINTVTAIKTGAVNAWNSLKTSVVSAVNSLKSSVIGAWNTLKSTVTTTVTTLVDNVKGLFNFDLKLPEIKLPTWEDIKGGLQTIINNIKDFFANNIPKIDLKVPKINIDGGEIPWGIGGKGRKPNIDITWERKAYNNPVMFTRPTVLATPNGNYGFGDGHGAEIVLGLNKLRELVGASSGSTVINVYPPAGANVQEIAAAVEQRLVAAQQRRMRVYA